MTEIEWEQIKDKEVAEQSWGVSAKSHGVFSICINLLLKMWCIEESG